MFPCSFDRIERGIEKEREKKKKENKNICPDKELNWHSLSVLNGCVSLEEKKVGVTVFFVYEFVCVLSGFRIPVFGVC